jgi:ribosome-binding factor A
MQRVNDQIRDELAELLMHEARDPRLQGMISVTGVETAPDLSQSRVFVSVLGTAEEAEATVLQMQRAASFFRRELAARLNLRKTPALEFRLDRSIAEGAKINQLLRELGRG